MPIWIIASGYLTHSLLHTQSDNHLMSWLARMQTKLKEIIGQLIGMGHELESAAEQNSEIGKFPSNNTRK